MVKQQRPDIRQLIEGRSLLVKLSKVAGIQIFGVAQRFQRRQGTLHVTVNRQCRGAHGLLQAAHCGLARVVPYFFNGKTCR